MKRMKKLLVVLCSAVFVVRSAQAALPVYAANKVSNAEGYHDHKLQNRSFQSTPMFTSQVILEMQAPTIGRSMAQIIITIK